MFHNYLFAVLLLLHFIVHPFYISLTEVRYNPKEKSLEISQKIFRDDLENALTGQYKSKVNFLTPANKTDLEKKIKKYILENNDIYVNGEKLALNYLGYELQEEAIWFYLEALNVPFPNTADIRNSLLHKNFDTQQNVINFYLDKNPKSLILLKGKDRGLISF
ncbi:DUF6702 family protein [Daejeonella sp.]|uniref:DUF6702 family protein n=1 Tax=Daejeonella sp. TaxID=2805397 RepID=UPI003983B14D